MALRRSRTTRPLFAHVVAALQTLHVLAAVGGNPTAFGLIALYVTGLVLLDARHTQPRISAALPRCAQPTVADDAAVHAGAHGGVAVVRPALEPAAGHARLPVRGR